MNTLLFLSTLSLLTLALPLFIYKHKLPVIAVGCAAEAFAIALIYSSTFFMCSDKSACGASWANTAIPLLIMAMNIGMIWPILGGYAKQAEKEAKQEKNNN